MDKVSAVFSIIAALDEFNVHWRAVFAGVREQLRSISPVAEDFQRLESRCKRLEEAGWLPHSTSPWHLLDNEELNGDQLNEAVQAYYVDNWQSVRASITEVISNLKIDLEAKDTFREALCAHEAGLFRCVARTLFPEIERVSRIEIYDGAMTNMASLQKLQTAVGQLTPSDLARDGISGVRLYSKLVHHLYISTRTPDCLEAMAAEPVPNRHAAIHGYVSYNTFRSSINAIIISEYIMEAISVIINYRKSEDI